jgi:NAD(P)-dependent dehydrogenase (short-subunit alcohol dehydrogenase family)
MELDGVVDAEVFELQNAQGLKGLVSRCEATLGGIDTLINNAGVRHITPIDEVTEDAWREEIDIKVTVPFFLTQAVVPAMRRAGRGYIVNVASISGLMGYGNRAGYCAGNAGMLGLTRQNAVELAPAGIVVNAIAPGFIETPLTNYPAEVSVAMSKMVPLGRRGTVDEVARAVGFLCSEENTYMTGATLIVDGGLCEGFVVDAEPWKNRYQ